MGAPLWETTVAQLRTPRARSNTSYRTSLGDDSCAVASTQSQIKHLLPHLSGRRQLRSCEHPEPDQAPPAALLWETTVAHLRAPRARSSTSYRTSLGDDSCALATTQSQIKHLPPHFSGRRQLRTCEHPEPDQAPPTAPLWETTVAHLRAPRARSSTYYRTSLGDDSCALANTQSQTKHLLPHLSGRRQLRTCEHPEPDQAPPTAPLW